MSKYLRSNENFLIDCHCHMTDPRLTPEQVQSIYKSIQDQGIKYLVQGGIGPDEWKNQILLKQKFPNTITCFGLHPYWVSEHNDDECEKAIDELTQMMSDAQLIGELGLDMREPYLPYFERQVDFFRMQVELARANSKSMVLHLVKAFDEFNKLLIFDEFKNCKVMVHSFNSSFEQAQVYTKRGFYLSIGCALLFEKNKKLRDAVLKTPIEHLLIETDSPDQPPPNIEKGQNRPENIIKVALMLAEIKNLTLEQVLAQIRLNFENFSGIKL